MIKHKPKETAPALWLEASVFMSSYYPLFLILFIRDVDESTVGIQFGLDSWSVNVSFWALTLLTLSSFSTLIVGPLMRKLLTHQEGGHAIKVEGADQVRGDMLNYTLPFLIGLFAFDYNSWQSISSLLIFLMFIFSFVHKEQISLLNPMFLLMGIRLYNIKYKEVGRENYSQKIVLCWGKLEKSDIKIELKETVGVHFVFPELKPKD
jgi:hypothetical protein